jgi:thiol-disulfide isomerase/thioredoxin
LGLFKKDLDGILFVFVGDFPGKAFALLEVNGVEKKILFMVSGILIVSTMMISGCSYFPYDSGIEVGQPAPNFKLQDLYGREVSLDQYRGRVVLLDFWATWCGPCRMSMPLLERLQKEFPSTLILLAINLQDTKDEVKDFVYKMGLKSQILLDEDGTVGQTYGAGTIPLEVLIDKEGIVRFAQNGFDPGSTIAKLRAQIEQLR